MQYVLLFRHGRFQVASETLSPNYRWQNVTKNTQFRPSLFFFGDVKAFTTDNGYISIK